MFRTVDSRNSGRNQAVVLEEVEMPPRELLEVMGLTGITTFWARVENTPGGFDVQE